MKIFLAGTNGEEQNIETVLRSSYLLESFYYFKPWQVELLKKCEMFMLDSGAFTLFSGKRDINWEEYVDRYAEFINTHDIDYYFELDIDVLIGYKNVLKLRQRLETRTGKRCIPVWHFNRGKEEFIRHCEEYKYVALGGYVAAIKAGDTRQKKYIASYPWFINEAHKRNAKIHGLGFTSLTGLKRYHFDSVDSTAWTTGNRFGYLYHFKNGNIVKTDVPKGQRLKDAKTVALNNYTEWIKFQKWADIHL